MNKKNKNLNIDKFILFICFCYGFTGINFIITGMVVGLHSKYFISCIIIAIIMLCMVPVSLFDERKEMRGKFSAIVCGVMHFVISIFISYIHSFWSFMVLYVAEFIISMISVRVVMNKKHK